MLPCASTKSFQMAQSAAAKISSKFEQFLLLDDQTLCVYMDCEMYLKS